MNSIQSTRSVLSLPTQRATAKLTASAPRHGRQATQGQNKPGGPLADLLPRNEPRGTHVVSVGGGPRGVIQAMAEMQLIQSHAGDFHYLRALGGQYNMRTTIVERGGEGAVGRGNAWGEEQGLGTVNTGAETVAPGLLNYENRLSEYAQKNHKDLANEASQNPVVASLLARGFDGSRGPVGQPMVGRSMMTRAQQGREEAETFKAVREQMAKNPAYNFYHLDVQTHTSVKSIDITEKGTPSQPVLKLKKEGWATRERTLKVDGVRLNTGTTMVSPIRNEAVRQHSFIEAMDHVKLTDFLKSKDLLDEEGHLKQGAKIVLGGTSLSAYDQLLALTTKALPVWERDDNHPMGYKVREDMKERYQGAVVFVSNTGGKWVPPRHAHNPFWSQTTAPLGNAQEQHAMFLHKQGEEVFGAWNKLSDASVAVSQGIVPTQVSQRGLSTPGLLDAQHASSMRSATKLQEARDLPNDSPAKQQRIAESVHTLEGARRQAYFSTLLGMGMESDPARVEELNELAPATYAGRGGYPMIRALPKSISEPGTDAWRNNVATMKRFEAMSGEDLIASPMYVHDCAAQLFESGIATHLQASYGDIKVGGEGERALSITGSAGQHVEFDAFIVSPTFQRHANPAVMSLKEQNKPMHPQLPEVGEVAVNRRILDKHGQPSNVQDLSLNGKGGAVDIGGGQWRKTAVFGYDVNNRESAVETASGLALHRVSKDHLVAAGFDKPDELLAQLYQHFAPTDAQHEQEVAGFKPHFDAAMARASFLDAASVAAKGDGETFRKLADVSREITAARQPSVATIATLIEPILAADQPAKERLLASYADALHNKPEFAPASNADFQKRFIDLPQQTHENVYKMVMTMAHARLTGGSLV